MPTKSGTGYLGTTLKNASMHGGLKCYIVGKKQWSWVGNVGSVRVVRPGISVAWLLAPTARFHFGTPIVVGTFVTMGSALR
eukprot:1137779-Pelagomonas_calceolata.AAC.2